MAPEQAAGEIRKLDARTDVFGLGAMLCEILTAAPPYRGRDEKAARLQAVRWETADAFARLDGCGAEPDLVALCKRCLAFKQEDRPAEGTAVAQQVAETRHTAEACASRGAGAAAGTGCGTQRPASGGGGCSGPLRRSPSSCWPAWA
ncbi:MAG: hypothetical protein K6T86_00510 [Pirellulales bacterium]|nr:hypothetical protein [Pirellulales bacterium]